MPRRVVVVFGAGNMGALVAYLYAAAGFKVLLVDTNEQVLSLAATRHDSLKAASAWGVDQQLEISYHPGDPTTDGEIQAGLRAAELVVDATTEDLAIKRQLFAEVEPRCSSEAILATISSAIPVREITDALTHRNRVCNMHFLQQGIAAVEVMGGPDTSEETLRHATELLETAGMIPFVLNIENKGFLFNVIWRAIKKTCLDLVARGVGTPQQIDRIWMLALKTPIGPFGLMDLVGLHTVHAIEEEYARVSGDPSDRPPAFLTEMVRSGQTGVRAAKGFYSYPGPAYRQPGFLETGLPNGGQGAPPKRVVKETLVRSWKLKSFTAVNADGSLAGYPMGEQVEGTLTYSADGRVWVYLSSPDRQRFSSENPRGGTPEEQAEAYRSCFFYTGTFVIGDSFVVHRIEQCSFPNWIGRHEKRSIEVTPTSLVLRTPPMEVGTLNAIQRLEWTPLG